MNTENFELTPDSPAQADSGRIQRKRISERALRALEWAIFALQDVQPHQLNKMKALNLCRDSARELEKAL